MNRYRTDSDYREYRRRVARQSYVEAREPAEQPPLTALQTDLIGDVAIREPRDTRCGTSVACPLYPPGAVATILGLSTQSLRLWSRNHILPPALFATGDGRCYRLYTYDQVAAVFEAIPLLSDIPRNGRENSSFAKQLRLDWARMPDGIEPLGYEPDVPADLLEDLPTRSYVYALSDPRTHETRYVGQSMNPNHRHEEHVAVVTRRLPEEAASSSLRTWIRSLLDEGLEPEMTILEATSKGNVNRAEERWVQTLRAEGAHLLNDRLNGLMN